MNGRRSRGWGRTIRHVAHHARGRRGRAPAPAVGTPQRRGVVGILAMMFLVMFGSLAVAMAVVTQGNLRTAASHLRVTRALGAVDTGMEIAASRLSEAAERFVVSKGEVDAAYALALWNGTYDDDPAVTVLPPPDGRVEEEAATSIREALLYHHQADEEGNTVAEDGSNAPAPIVLPDPPTGWLVAAPIGIARNGAGDIVTAAQITYVPPDEAGRVLVVVTGYDWDHTRGAWVTRTAQQYFEISKRIEHAVLSPSRVMIGRNVQVDGPVGVRYASAALDELDGPPLTVKSDFEGLDDQLDEMLEDFYEAVLDDDVDGDNRLRVNHAVESSSLDELNLIDYDNDAEADNAFIDLTSDNAVDEFDLFLNRFDANGDGRVAISDALREGTPGAALTAEFTLDDSLALLIDSGVPDRNGNGRFNGAFTDGAWDYSTFRDNNGDGTKDEEDVDADDVTLGYRDGALDFRDRYAKIRGSAYLVASRQQWEASHDEFGNEIDDYQKLVEGAIRSESGERPMTFEADDAEVPQITAESFEDATEALKEIASDGEPFSEQVESQTEPGWTPSTVIEPTPYGSLTPADWYARPVYEGMVFRDVTIPMGTNALFKNCTFIGVTRVECYQDNTHPSWSFYGEEVRDPETGALSLKYPPPPAESEAQLDKSYAEEGSPGYDDLPDPLFVTVDLDGDGEANDQCTNTKLVCNNIRFHDCTFVGSIVSDTPQVFTHVRNKLAFTGATKFVKQHPEYPDDPDYNPDADDMAEINKSSMMLPQYSVDIGTNNASPDQDVRLEGAIIAGVLDVRGNTMIDGVLLMTFEPVYGSAPLEQYGEAVGNPAGFNVTLGYFGPEDGDGEGINLSELEDLDGDGELDVGWDSARDENGNLIPLEGWDGVHIESWYDGIVEEDTEIDPGTYVRRAVPFNGYGKVQLKYNPELVLPDGLAVPISVTVVRGSYTEGRFVIEEEEGEGE